MRLIRQDAALELAAGIDKDDRLLDVIDRGDVLIEFAHHTATTVLAQAAAERGKALVIGTTGHTSGERQAIEAACAARSGRLRA